MLNIYISKHTYKLESGIIYVISYNRENVKCKHKKKELKDYYRQSDQLNPCNSVVCYFFHFVFFCHFCINRIYLHLIHLLTFLLLFYADICGQNINKWLIESNTIQETFLFIHFTVFFFASRFLSLKFKRAFRMCENT